MPWLKYQIIRRNPLLPVSCFGSDPRIWRNQNLSTSNGRCPGSKVVWARFCWCKHIMAPALPKFRTQDSLKTMKVCCRETNKCSFSSTFQNLKATSRVGLAVSLVPLLALVQKVFQFQVAMSNLMRMEIGHLRSQDSRWFIYGNNMTMV